MYYTSKSLANYLMYIHVYVRRFVDSNIPFSVNSDDPGLMRTTLSHDYQKVVETFGISRDYLSKIVSMHAHSRSNQTRLTYLMEHVLN